MSNGMIEVNQGAIDALVAEAYGRGLATAQEHVYQARLQLQAEKKHSRELHDALEPKQQQIKELSEQVTALREVVNELRTALLHHVKETY